MKERLHTWWQKVKKPLEIIGVTTILVLIFGLVVLIVAGYIFKWSWTGFEPETSTPQQHAKTLWDWLQLLIIPLVLAVGGYVFNLTVSRNEQQNTRVRDQTEREISLDNQQEAALQAYIDNMSELLLYEKLRESVAENEVRKIARVRTLTVLPRLDNKRKGSVLQFLHESGLIEKDKTIVDLNGASLIVADLNYASLSSADLSDANLRGANLRGADLSGADLSDANLRGANLNDANLNDASFSGAILNDADLSGANLSGANFSTAKLNNANLSGAVLNDAILIAANLNNANLSGAILNDADLRGANLRGANFSTADLSTANLSHADLTYTNFSNAIVTQEQLDKANSLQRTTMPNGSIHA